MYHCCIPGRQILFCHLDSFRMGKCVGCQLVKPVSINRFCQHFTRKWWRDNTISEDGAGILYQKMMKGQHFTS